MAQVYNHVIMPLASTRDRVTQIRWGIADFEKRFQRKPEGMWLPETAVDTETLELLAAEAIRFVVLAPYQCARVRPLTEVDAVQLAFENVGQPEKIGWTVTPDASVDTTRPYLVRLKDNRSIAVFFYDGPRSRAIAFEGLLNDGETFARRLLEGFSENSTLPQLVHVATDGESYGHHHRYGEMALAFALKWIEERGLRAVYKLWGVSGKIPSGIRSPDRRGVLLELHPRHRALALQLRLQPGSCRMDPAVARPTARGFG